MAWSSKISSDTIMYLGYGGMFFFLPIARSPVEISCGLVLAAWLLSGRFLRDYHVWLRSRFIIPILLLIVIPWVGMIYTPTPTEGLRLATKGYFWLFALPLMALPAITSRGDIFLKLFLAGLSINCAVSLMQLAGVVPLRYGSPSGLLGISSPWITFSLLLTVGILILFHYITRAASLKQRLFYVSLAILFFFTLGTVGGRSGYLAFALLLPLFAFLLLGRRHLVKIVLSCAVILGILGTFPVVQSRVAQVANELEMYDKGVIDTSIGLRLHMWDLTLSEIRDNPLVGVGTGGFRKVWETKKDSPSLPFHDHPHNSFLFVTVSYGITGLVALCWLFIALMTIGIRHRHSLPGFSVLAFVSVLFIGSLTDTQILPFPTAMGLILFTGIAGALDAQKA